MTGYWCSNFYERRQRIEFIIAVAYHTDVEGWIFVNNTRHVATSQGCCDLHQLDHNSKHTDYFCCYSWVWHFFLPTYCLVIIMSCQLAGWAVMEGPVMAGCLGETGRLLLSKERIKRKSDSLKLSAKVTGVPRGFHTIWKRHSIKSYIYITWFTSAKNT